MRQKYQLAFYDNKKQRILCLKSYSPLPSVFFALKNYQLPNVSFVNVFTEHRFTCRLYVRHGSLAPHVGTIYNLRFDQLVREKLVSERPVIDWKRLLSVKVRPLPSLSSFLIRSIIIMLTTPACSYLVYHTAHNSNNMSFLI